jgi:predicted acyltransferase
VAATRQCNMRSVELSHTLQTRRIESIDALRGINMFWLIGFDGAMVSLAEMTRDKGPLVSAIGNFLGTQFVHESWEGLHFYDFIFALFIFIIGVSIVLSLPASVERGGRAETHLRVMRRSFLLFLIGIVVYGIGQNWWDVRLLGVLQRIALCYFFTSLMFLNFNLRGMIAALVTLLIGYWALMTFIPVPGIGAGSYAPDANLANWIDQNYLPGRLWDLTRDPEGMLSTLPAIGTCLFGVFAGLLMRDARISPGQKTLCLITGGCMLLAAGYLWALQFPIVKAIWTSSFVLVTAGYSGILLGLIQSMRSFTSYRLDLQW